MKIWNWGKREYSDIEIKPIMGTIKANSDIGLFINDELVFSVWVSTTDEGNENQIAIVPNRYDDKVLTPGHNEVRIDYKRRI